MTNTLVMLLVLMVPLTLQNVISIAQGKLRGVSNGGYISYQGIPYATVAEELGKFKRAGIAPTWQGIRAPQQSYYCSITSKLEECLQLDVYTPLLSGGSFWPVLVWVTGGTGPYNPGKLVLQGIIVVVVQHRFGPLGFLCLNEEQIPGNAGIKDVVLALRWVRDNIVAFKGNPAKVTVAGQGFGAAMVEALMLSPMAHGLFHAAILQSGTILSPWAFNYDAKERAQQLGEMFPESDNITSVLITATGSDLAENYKKLDVSYFPFGICVEKSFKNEERFLSDSPFDLLSRKKIRRVPLIIGYNNNEAYIFVLNLEEAKAVNRMPKDLSFLLAEELKFLNEKEMKSVVKKIKEKYFSKNATLSALLTYFRDAFFLNHIYRSANLHASVSETPVYFYQFSHVGYVGVESEPGVHKIGAAHSDELAYLFSDNSNDLEGDDGVVQQHLIRLWTNFVKNLTPTNSVGESTHWEEMDPGNPRMLMIDTKLDMKDFPYIETMKMWNNIYDKYYYTRIRSGV